MGGARAKKGGQKKKNKIKGKGAKEGGPKSTPAGSSSSGGASGLSEQDGASAVPAGGSSPPAGSGRAVEAAPLVSDTGESDSDFVYSFEDTAGIEGVSIVHDDSGAVLSDSGERAWSWRQWDGGKVLARYLEQSCSSEVAGQVVVELGAGTGLVSLVAARLGAAGVAATDLAHGMDLLKHNAGRNLLAADAAEPEPEPAAAGGSSEATSCCCPEGHVLLSRAAECEDYICNVCDSDIDEGGTLWSCTEERCEGFDLCGNCEGKARAGEWVSLPTWFKVQSQVHQARSGAAAAKIAGETSEVDARTAQAFQYPRRTTKGGEGTSKQPLVGEEEKEREVEEEEKAMGGTLLVEELDWSDESGVARLYGSLSKALPSQPQEEEEGGAAAAGMGMGMLVLGADLSYDRDTIVLLVSTISRLKLSSHDQQDAAAAAAAATAAAQGSSGGGIGGGHGPAVGRSMLLVHDKRNEATTEFLLEQLASAGLLHTLEDHASAAESFGLPTDRMMLMRIALC
jgi:hypothetical protein